MEKNLVDVDQMINERIIYLAKKLEGQSLEERIEELVYIQHRVKKMIEENVIQKEK